jgi:hypothetical protein
MKMRVLLVSGAACGAWLGGLAAMPARAVIVHPGEEFTVPALENVVGRWSDNASAVAIAPNYIITTRHQNGGVGTTVVFGGTSYVVDQEILVGSADLRIARLANANLTQYTPIYTGNDVGVPVTIGGFGRGAVTTPLTTTGGTYGYAWDNSSNTTLRFGHNMTDDFVSSAPDTILTNVAVVNDLLVADFDGPSALSPGEGMIALFDSGGGWFVDNNGTWQVAALSRAIDHSGPNADDPLTIGTTDPQPQAQALFASFQNAELPAPDYLDGIRLSSYREFINGQVPEPGTGAVLIAAGSLLGVRRRRH